MILLGQSAVTVDGITVYPDHADPSQFWVLPGPVSLARRPDDGRAAFTFIQYRPAAVAAGARGGGFLMFEVSLRLDPQLERRILSRLAPISRGRPKLAVVPFDEGTVQCIALNLQGSGGTAATVAADGTFNAVERILGATTPTLDAENRAAFSLTLSQEGTTILQQAFEEGATPVGVVYELKYTAMRPALDVKITADFKRIYDHFSAGLDAQVYFVKAGIDAGFEKLVQDGVIDIQVTNFTGDADLEQKEKWALDFFKESLLADWFRPTLTPGQLAGGGAQAGPLQEVVNIANALRPPTPPAPPQPAATPPAPRPNPGPSPTQGTGRQADGGSPVPPPAAQPTPPGESPTAGTASPPPSQPVPPAAAVGVSVPPAPPQAAGTAATAAGGGMPAVVSFKLKFIRQEELKTLTLHYNRQDATQRTYAPQGFFGLLTADLDRAGHFVEVDLDDPFFRVFTITADAPVDFDQIGLTSAHVSLDYGDPAQPATLKHTDFVFEPDDNEEKKFEVFMSRNLDTAYRCQVQYHFNPQSGWDGERFTYELPPASVEDRTLLINPFEHIGFLEVRVFPAQVDWDLVDAVNVLLHYEGPTGQRHDRDLRFTKATPEAFWRLRLTDPAARDYTYRLVYTMKDGTTRESEPVTTRATSIPFSDPFEGSLEIEFIPLFDPSTVRMVFIDFQYDDDANNYHRQERLQLRDDLINPVSLSISLMDPTKRTFKYRVTYVGTDNSMTQQPTVETEETLIGLVN